MTQALAHSTILIVEGRSISSFKLRTELENQGAYVSTIELAAAETARRQVRPDVVLIDFSLADKAEGFAAAVQEDGIKHLFCSSPNRHQAVAAQTLAAQDVAVALSEIVTSRTAAPLPWQSASRLDPELYAI